MSRAGAWILLAGALTALLAVRLLALRFNATDLFFDEAQYWSWSLEPAFGYYSKPPLVAWLIGLSGKLCGDSPFCIRLPAPLIHTVTAAIIFLIGRRLHGDRVGLWSALTFATLPGISLSSGIISTDVPLLLGWAVALWGYIALVQGAGVLGGHLKHKVGSGWLPALALGLGLGFGLNAKYAMAFFVLSIAVHMTVTPPARRLLTDARLWMGLAIGALLIAPNMLWNWSNSFATFAHTADNAKWGSALVNAGKGLEFVAAQLGVFGPILFVALIATAWRAWKEGMPESDRLLLAFTLPVLTVITAQAFASRAHANWAAVSYVAGSILVCSTLVRLLKEKWLRISLAVHAAILLALAFGSAFAGRFTLPLVGDPFTRTLGWKEIAEATQAQIDKLRSRTTGRAYNSIISDERALTAELLYYMRDFLLSQDYGPYGTRAPLLAWRDGGRPKDHYELTRPFIGKEQDFVLLIAVRADTDRILKRFEQVQLLSEEMVPAGLGPKRRVRFYMLTGFKPQ